jgi:hypothetical protein
VNYTNRAAWRLWLVVGSEESGYLPWSRIAWLGKNGCEQEKEQGE